LPAAVAATDDGRDRRQAMSTDPERIDTDRYNSAGKLRSAVYEAEMARLQEQLVLLQYWIQSQGLKVLVIFEGRGSAGKGGVIQRIT
jgi:polyphosphate kinase 2 (PPK2 family)